MTIEKFIDGFGDDVYALALIVTKSFEGAEQVFTQLAQDCESLPETAELYDIAKRTYRLCRKAPSNDSAQTLSDIGLSAKHEALLADIFPCPQIVRAIIHLSYENDLENDKIASITDSGVHYVNEQLGDLGGLADRLEKSYKELCLKLAAPDELKVSVIQAVKSGDKRLFEVRDSAAPRHSWTKPQKLAAVVFAVAATALVCIVIPLLTAYFNSFDEMNSSYEEIPDDWIFSYTTTQTEHIPSE